MANTERLQPVTTESRSPQELAATLIRELGIEGELARQISQIAHDYYHDNPIENPDPNNTLPELVSIPNDIPSVIGWTVSGKFLERDSSGNTESVSDPAYTFRSQGQSPLKNKLHFNLEHIDFMKNRRKNEWNLIEMAFVLANTGRYDWINFISMLDQRNQQAYDSFYRKTASFSFIEEQGQTYLVIDLPCAFSRGRTTLTFNLAINSEDISRWRALMTSPETVKRIISKTTESTSVVPSNIYNYEQVIEVDLEAITKELNSKRQTPVNWVITT